MSTVKAKHKNIEFNASELYMLLFKMVEKKESLKLLGKYLKSIKDSEVRQEIAAILYQVSRIFKYAHQDKNRFLLPEIFCAQPWRAQNLVFDILSNKFDFVEAIHWLVYDLSRIEVDLNELNESSSMCERNLKEDSVNYNMSELYFLLHLIIGDDDTFKLLRKYIKSLKRKLDKDSDKPNIRTVLYQLSMIFLRRRQHQRYPLLPEVFCTEPWRGQRLVDEILVSNLELTNDINCKIKISESIDSWATQESKYL